MRAKHGFGALLASVALAGAAAAQDTVYHAFYVDEVCGIDVDASLAAASAFVATVTPPVTFALAEGDGRDADIRRSDLYLQLTFVLGRIETEEGTTHCYYHGDYALTRNQPVWRERHRLYASKMLGRFTGIVRVGEAEAITQLFSDSLQDMGEGIAETDR